MRLLLFVLCWRWLKRACPWMFDGPAAAASVNASLAEERARLGIG